MTTELGRVVYDRKKNVFSIKDIARIVRSQVEENYLPDHAITIAKIEIEMMTGMGMNNFQKAIFFYSSILPVARYLGIAADELGKWIGKEIIKLIAEGSQAEWYV